jgi:uncharacterized protein YndB with AHSA1/START domain
MDPLVKKVRVEATVEEAFRRFTHEMGTWWPMAVHSVSREACRTVRFGSAVGADLVEEAEDGSIHVWGTVTAWDPPSRVSFTWHPGRDANGSQDVTVSFEPDGAGTLVRLVHTGWERLGDAAAETRQGYDAGWDGVLGLFGDSFARTRTG